MIFSRIVDSIISLKRDGHHQEDGSGDCHVTQTISPGSYQLELLVVREEDLGHGDGVGGDDQEICTAEGNQ